MPATANPRASNPAMAMAVVGRFSSETELLVESADAVFGVLR